MAGKYWPRDAKGTAPHIGVILRVQDKGPKAEVISRSVSKTRVKLKINLGVVGRFGVAGLGRDFGGIILAPCSDTIIRFLLGIDLMFGEKKK